MLVRAGAVLGGRVVAVTNQHYGPAVSVIAPHRPLGMFDGFETARSRAPLAIAGAAAAPDTRGEHLELQLAVPCAPHRIVLDFSFFVNNNPREVAVDAQDAATGQWVRVVPRRVVKHFRGNTVVLDAPGVSGGGGGAFGGGAVFSRVRVHSIPCGGYNRVRILARATEGMADEAASARARL
jgi:allantoicase